MTALELRARQWCSVASMVAQLAATAAGMLPWWALPLTIALTVVVSRPPHQLDQRRIDATRRIGIACVAAFAGLTVFRAIAGAGEGVDPIAALRSLTETLVILSLIMAPSTQTPREHRVWLTVTTGVLVAAAAGAHSPTATVITAAGWVVLLTAMAKVQLTAMYADGAVPARTTAETARPATVRGRLPVQSWLPVAAALAAGALVFVAVPSGLGGGGLASRIAHHVKGPPNDSAAGRAAVGVDTVGDGELSLLVRGPLPTTPLLQVPLRSPQLWRGTMYAAYTGTSWVAPAGSPTVLVRGNAVRVPSRTTDPRPHGRTRTDQVHYLGPFHGALVWAPGVPRRIRGTGGTMLGVTRNDANTRIFGAWRLRGYAVTSTVATTAAAKLRLASGTDPTDPIWTQLPPELPSEISTLAHQITAHTTNRYQQVTDLETYLRTHETYSLTSPVPGEGQDAVADFLFRDHTGFCEQFASAEAVMLRTLGVPARVISGLAYGLPSGSSRVLTAADAHAWVEVYYPGIGWSPTDPTAGAVLAGATPANRHSVTKTLEDLTNHLPGGHFGASVAILIVLAGLGIAARSAVRSRRTRRGGRTTPGRVAGPILVAFQRLADHGRGPARRTPGETAREYLARTAPNDRTDDALVALEQECYGAEPPDDATATAAVETFAELIGAAGHGTGHETMGA